MVHYRQNIPITLSYDVYFTKDLFSPKNDVLNHVFRDKNRKVLVFMDDGVSRAWPKLDGAIKAWAKTNAPQLNILGVEVVEGGEAIKNDSTIVEFIGKTAKSYRLCRHSYIVAIGGGAVLDAVGYASSIIHRGIRLVRVPTTVLAMNDSGVGVKNGVNRFGLKNFYGVFTPPIAVVSDLNFLQTLPDRVWLSGISEAFKVGLIKDAKFLQFLLNNLEQIRGRKKNVEEIIIKRTAELHMNHIAEGGDPLEHGTSRPLDFGHWAAHKLESMTNFRLLHGEAVSIGITLDLYYASLIGLISRDDASRVTTGLKEIGLPVYHPFLSERHNELLSGLQEFREHLGGDLTIAMPNPIGKKTDINEIDPGLLGKAISLIEQSDHLQ